MHDLFYPQVGNFTLALLGSFNLALTHGRIRVSVAGPTCAAQRPRRCGDHSPAWRCDSGMWAGTVVWCALWQETSMAGDALAAMEALDGVGGDAHVHLFFDERMGHGVVMGHGPRCDSRCGPGSASTRRIRTLRRAGGAGPVYPVAQTGRAGCPAVS